MGTSLQVLTQGELAQVHERTLEVLGRIGMRVDSVLGRQILRDAGARVDEESRMVRFPAALIEQSLLLSPKRFTVAGRRPDWSFPMNAGQATLVIDGEATSTVDRATRLRRPCTLIDWTEATRLIDALDEIGIWWGMLTGGRSGETMADAVSYFTRLFGGFSKHVQDTIIDPAEAPWLLEVLEIVFGGRDEIRRRHPFSTIITPVSPLIIEDNGTDQWLALRGYDIPVSVMPMPLMGATAPGSMLATVLQANCEVIGMLCLIQAAEPGVPFIYSPVLASMDPRSGRFADAIGNSAMSVAGIEMARYYDLPAMGSGPVTDHFVPGIQSGYEKTFSTMPSALAWPDWLVSPGTLGGATVFSFEQVLIDVEVWRMSRKLHEGISVDEDKWLIDVLERVGPGGHFLGETTTRKNARSGEWFRSTIGLHEASDAWEVAGEPELIDQLRDKVEEILATHEALPLGKDVERELAKLHSRAQRV